ncbi:MAG: MBL fold metallo-hydrolase [Acidimicrobiales bacterium]
MSDMFMPDQGPAHRPGPASGPPRSVATMEQGCVPSALVAEHGFSALVNVSCAGHGHRVLFDAGVSPDGVVDNMGRLDLSPHDLEMIVCSHGHLDHTTGLDGIIRALGRTNLPVLIHPDFWNRRRLILPGRDPVELPTTSRRALEDAGFDLVEERHPSFLLHGSLLVTGEVDRTTGYEPGFPLQEAYGPTGWEPDPLVLDDQALVAHVRGKGLVVLTGCGHSGVINICRYAMRLTDVPHVAKGFIVNLLPGSRLRSR